MVVIAISGVLAILGGIAYYHTATALLKLINRRKKP